MHDLPPPLPIGIPILPPPELTTSVPSSRAQSVQPVEHAMKQQPTPTKKKSKRELPEILMDFLAMLPPPHLFDGATFHVEELLKLIRNADVPLPAVKRGREEEEDGRGNKKYRDD